MSDLNKDMVVAIKKQGRLIHATQNLFNEVTQLAEDSRSKRSVPIATFGKGEHPHGPSYYSAKTLRYELEKIDSTIAHKKTSLHGLQAQCTAEQQTKQDLLKQIMQDAATQLTKAADQNTSTSVHNINYLNPASFSSMTQQQQQQQQFGLAITPLPPPPPPKLANRPMNHIRTALLCYQKYLQHELHVQQIQAVLASPVLQPREQSKKAAAAAAAALAEERSQCEDNISTFNNNSNYHSTTSTTSTSTTTSNSSSSTTTNSGNQPATSPVRKTLLSWDSVQTSLEQQRQEDRHGLWTVGLASNRIAQQAKAGLAKTKRILKSNRRRRSVMLRGVASSSTVPSPRGRSGTENHEETELSVSADWLTRNNSRLSTISRNSSFISVGEEDDEEGWERSAEVTSNTATAAEPVQASRTLATSNRSNSSGGALLQDNDSNTGTSVPTQWLQMLFNRMDKDDSGDVDRTEFIEGMKNDVDMLQLFDIKAGDPTNQPSFKTVFDAIDDDGSSSITFEEFAAFFESRENGYFYAGDKIDALYEAEGIWYTAKVIRVVKEEGESEGSDGAEEGERDGRVTAYTVRYMEYPEEGPFRVLTTETRPRFKTGVQVRVLLGDHTILETGELSTVVEQTDRGYVVALLDSGEKFTVFASDVFPFAVGEDSNT